MNTLILPDPDILQQRIEVCEAELKALRKLQRMADATYEAEEARSRRVALEQGQEARHD